MTPPIHTLSVYFWSVWCNTQQQEYEIHVNSYSKEFGKFDDNICCLGNALNYHIRELNMAFIIGPDSKWSTSYMKNDSNQMWIYPTGFMLKESAPLTLEIRCFLNSDAVEQSTSFRKTQSLIINILSELKGIVPCPWRQIFCPIRCVFYFGPVKKLLSFNLHQSEQPEQVEKSLTAFWRKFHHEPTIHRVPFNHQQN